MKRVLITGANSYVGTNVEKWLMREPDKYYVETLDMKDANWKNFDFSRFDVVFHVAGVAHVSTKKSMKDLYFKVNRDLTIETAIKAKEYGVKQFIFMSSMIVYNSKETRITLDTIPNPDNFYGLSKLQAEERITTLKSDKFNVCILRPPMIYGKESKGNFIKLASLAEKLIIFPNFKNIRSSIYIDNLSMYIAFLIQEGYYGIFFPQNQEYFSSIGLIKMIREIFGKKIFSPVIFNVFVKVFKKRITLFTKLFSDYYYDIAPVINLDLISFEESVKLIVKRNKNDE